MTTHCFKPGNTRHAGINFTDTDAICDLWAFVWRWCSTTAESEPDAEWTRAVKEEGQMYALSLFAFVSFALPDTCSNQIPKPMGPNGLVSWSQICLLTSTVLFETVRSYTLSGKYGRFCVNDIRGSVTLDCINRFESLAYHYNPLWAYSSKQISKFEIWPTLMAFDPIYPELSLAKRNKQTHSVQEKCFVTCMFLLSYIFAVMLVSQRSDLLISTPFTLIFVRRVRQAWVKPLYKRVSFTSGEASLMGSSLDYRWAAKVFKVYLESACSEYSI